MIMGALSPFFGPVFQAEKNTSQMAFPEPERPSFFAMVPAFFYFSPQKAPYVRHNALTIFRFHPIFPLTPERIA